MVATTATDNTFTTATTTTAMIANGCPCIVETRGTKSYALATALVRKPCVPLTPTMHGQPFLILLI